MGFEDTALRIGDFVSDLHSAVLNVEEGNVENSPSKIKEAGDGYQRLLSDSFWTLCGREKVENKGDESKNIKDKFDNDDYDEDEYDEEKGDLAHRIPSLSTAEHSGVLIKSNTPPSSHSSGHAPIKINASEPLPRKSLLYPEIVPHVSSKAGLQA